MPLATLAFPVFWPGFYTNTGAAPTLGTDNTLDAAGEYQSYTFNARENMVISHVGFMPGTVAGSPTAEIRIESVDPATGFPADALWATDTNIVTGVLVSATWVLAALTAPATILMGQDFNVKIRYVDGTSMIVRRMVGMNNTIYSKPYPVTNTSGAPAKALLTGTPILALGSSATTFYNGLGYAPISVANANSVTNTNGARRGVRFKIPVPARLIGFRSFFNTSVGDFNAIVFDDAGTELNSSSTLVSGNAKFASAAGMTVAHFDNAVTLAKDTWYRVAFEPTSVTAVNITDFTSPSAAYLTGMPGGANYNLTTYASGAWDDTLTTRSPFMDLIFDQWNDNRAPRAQSMIGM